MPVQRLPGLAGRPARTVAASHSLRDRALMGRVQRGEGAALDELIITYWAPLVRYAERLVEDLDEAQDVVQEAFVQLWHRRCEWNNSSGSVQSYLYRLAHNRAVDELRKRKTRIRWAEGPGMLEANPPPSPALLLERVQLRDALDASIKALPQRRREVFTLAYLQGLPYREIADVMGISVKTVANQMWAAFAQVRRDLAPYKPESGAGADSGRPSEDSSIHVAR